MGKPPELPRGGDILRDREDVSERFQPFCVEALREEISLPQEQKKTFGGIGGRRGVDRDRVAR